MKIKRAIYQEDITVINIYIPNNRGPKFIKWKLIEFKGRTDSLAMKIREFNTPTSIVNETTRQKINKETENLNTINQLGTTGIYKILYPTRAEYMYFFWVCMKHCPG